MEKSQKFISNMLENTQTMIEESDDDFQIIVLERIKSLLEEYIV